MQLFLLFDHKWVTESALHFITEFGTVTSSTKVQASDFCVAKNSCSPLLVKTVALDHMLDHLDI